MPDDAQIAALEHELEHYERYGLKDRADQVRAAIKDAGGGKKSSGSKPAKDAPAAKEGASAKRRTATKTRRTTDK